MNEFRIETDESGIVLVVSTEDGESHRHAVTDPEALYDAVKSAIGPWLYERDQARRTLPSAFYCDPDESGGYEISDPKHTNFHSVHADLWDAREGK
jgi:hypothetical protein